MNENELNSEPAQVAGTARRISAAEKESALHAQDAVVRATVHVTRAGTGRVDTYEIVGTPIKEQ